MTDSFEICNCHCHQNRPGLEVKHIGPCCYTCEHCGQRIKVTFFEIHKKRCKPAMETALKVEPEDKP